MVSLWKSTGWLPSEGIIDCGEYINWSNSAGLSKTQQCNMSTTTLLTGSYWAHILVLGTGNKLL